MGYQPFTTGRVAVSSLPTTTSLVDVRLVQPKLEKKLLKGRKGSTTLIANVRAMRATGASLHEIAKHFNIAHTTVSRYTKDVPPPASGWKKGPRPSRLPREKILRMRRAGFTYREIAEDVGTTYRSVYNLVNDIHEVRPRSRRKADWFINEISKISGVPAAEFHAKTGSLTGRSFDDIARARYILFWMMVRIQGRIPASVAKQSGGFGLNSIINGVACADAVVKAHGLRTTGGYVNLMQRLWSADWAARKAA